MSTAGTIIIANISSKAAYPLRRPVPQNRRITTPAEIRRPLAYLPLNRLGALEDMLIRVAGKTIPKRMQTRPSIT